MRARTLLHPVLAALLMTAYAAAPADAAGRKAKKRHAATAMSHSEPSRERGQDKFMAGPLSAAGVYLGDDPDPFIRSQLYRDLSGRLGGEN